MIRGPIDGKYVELWGIPAWRRKLGIGDESLTLTQRIELIIAGNANGGPDSGPGSVENANARLAAFATLEEAGYIVQTSTFPPSFAGRQIVGVPNRINVTNGTGINGNTLLQTPQDIHEGATPSFQTIKPTLLNNDFVTYVDAVGELASTTTTATQLATAVASAAAMDILTTRGDLLSHDGTTYIRVAIGAANTVARTDGLDVLWGKVVLTTDVTGILPVANGGTAAATLTGIVQGNGVAAFTALTGTANYLPKWSATAPYLTATSLVYDNGTRVLINTIVDPGSGLLAIAGGLTLVGAQTIQTTTGNLTLASAAGNGNVVLTPHGTGDVTTPAFEMVMTSSAPTCTQLRFGDTGTIQGVVGTRFSLGSTVLASNAKQTTLNTDAWTQPLATWTSLLFDVVALNTTASTKFSWKRAPIGQATAVFGTFWTEIASLDYDARLTLGVAGSILGALRLAGNTSGNVTIQTAAIAGTWTLTLPVNDGNAGDMLITDGGGITSWTAPATVTPAALTKTDDTNITLTLGGSPTVALLAATSLTLGWTGVLSIARGGTFASSFAATEGVVYFDGTRLVNSADLFYLSSELVSRGVSLNGINEPYLARNINTGANAGTGYEAELADTSNNLITAGYITWFKEQSWTTVAATQDASATIGTTLDGATIAALLLRASGSVILGKDSTATARTDDFTYICTSNGPPTGVPTTFGSRVPMTFDPNTDTFYIYRGGWKGVVLV